MKVYPLSVRFFAILNSVGWANCLDVSLNNKDDIHII